MAVGRDLRSYGLTQFATFPSLGSGVLPNGQRSIETDLRFSISSTPGGFTAGYLADNLYDVLTPGAPLDANLDGQPDQPLPMAEDPLPVGNGDTISYTVRYENSGSAVAENVQIAVTTRGALRLVGRRDQPGHRPGRRGGRRLDHGADRRAGQHQLQRPVGRDQRSRLGRPARPRLRLAVGAASGGQPAAHRCADHQPDDRTSCRA